MLRFDRRLHIDAQAAGQIEVMLIPLLESPTIVLTDGYPYVLAAERIGEGVRVRPATGEEMTAFLTRGDVPNHDNFAWPDDPAPPDWREIEWQETQDGEVQCGPACRLWSGEVILNSGHGASGPFYVHEQAARAWAFATALDLQEREIFDVHVVPYHCVRRFAPNLITAGEQEAKRLSKFWMSPLRPGARVESFTLPMQKLLPTLHFVQEEYMSSRL